MQTVVFSVFLITILSLVSTLGSTQLEKHETMKLVVCDCQNKLHNQKPIHVFDKHEFMVIGFRNELRAVALPKTHLRSVLKNRKTREKPHCFVRYGEPNNSDSFTQRLPIHYDVFLYGCSKVLYKAKDNKLPLNSPSDPEASMNVAPLDGTVFELHQKGKKFQVIFSGVENLKKTGVNWESVINTTSSDGKYKYSMLFNSADVSQQKTTDKEGNIIFTQEEKATFVLFHLKK